MLINFRRICKQTLKNVKNYCFIFILRLHKQEKGDAGIYKLNHKRKNKMKRMKMNNVKLMALMVCGLIAFSLMSCSDDDDNYYPDGLADGVVTIKPTDGGKSFYMQLDDTTVIKAANMSGAPYGMKTVRAFIRFSLAQEQPDTSYKSVYVYAMDSIRTKKMAPNLGSENEKTYGTDWIDVISDWTTCCEDGYLTLHFTTFMGGKIHYVNLVAENPEKPYELTLFHNANGDSGNRLSNGFIAFSLADLPNTGDGPVDLTLKWKSQNGVMTKTFKFSNPAQTTNSK